MFKIAGAAALAVGLTQTALAKTVEFAFAGSISALYQPQFGSPGDASKIYSPGESVVGRLVYDSNTPRLPHPFVDTAFYFDYLVTSGLELTSKAGTLTTIGSIGSHEYTQYIGITIDHLPDGSTPARPDNFSVNEYGPFHAAGLTDAPYIYNLSFGLQYTERVPNLGLPTALSASMFSSGVMSIHFADGSFATVTLDLNPPVSGVPEPGQASFLLAGLAVLLGLRKISFGRR